MTKTRNRWIGLVFISMAISLVIIDGTIVNTIFPSVIRDLNLSSTEVQWVQESYVLVFASTLLVWGSLADKVGRRLLLLIGIVIFIAASVWAGSAEAAPHCARHAMTTVLSSWERPRRSCDRPKVPPPHSAATGT